MMATVTAASRPRHDEVIATTLLSPPAPDFGLDETWTLASTPIVQSHQSLIQAKIVDWVFVNIVIEQPKLTKNP